MCGIFGFALKDSVPMASVFRVLERLEVHQYPNEETPVGGYGAGVAVLEDDGSIVFEKVGKDNDVSPVKELAKIVAVGEASVLVGHVRMPSPEFMNTARFRETAQPYIVRRDSGLAVVSVHNGMVRNYKELRAKLGKEHVFESERAVRLIDSEVIPHVFVELLSEKQDAHEALLELFWRLQGPSAIALLHVEKKEGFLHFVHKGGTRGLSIWTNDKRELVFCSREESLVREFGSILSKGGFSKKFAIGWRENVGLVLSHPLSVR
jgi:glucosamine 6-phosphate synthetase-like amidotransferase/phosphosugar isomerase protein